MNIQKLFKPYIVTRKNGQCQILIPLIELDDLCDKIENVCRDAHMQGERVRSDRSTQAE